MKSPSKTDLASPASALASYLDDLLQTASYDAQEHEQEQEAQASVEAVVAVQPVGPSPLTSSTAVRGSEPVRSAPIAVPTKPAPVVTPVATVESVPVIQEPPPLHAPPSIRPDWSEAPFECLIFSVAGLQLAVPLVLLGAIHQIESKIKSIPGRPAWYMGMLPDRNQNLRVVDTAEWIMAGRVPVGAREGYRFVIRLDNSEWALACDDVAQSFTLKPDEVRWRSARSKRPWLAGTVIKHMCALIDVGTMASLLARAEREHTLTLD